MYKGKGDERGEEDAGPALVNSVTESNSEHNRRHSGEQRDVWEAHGECSLKEAGSRFYPPGDQVEVTGERRWVKPLAGEHQAATPTIFFRSGCWCESSHTHQRAEPEVCENSATRKPHSAAFLTLPNPFRRRSALHGKVSAPNEGLSRGVSDSVPAPWPCPQLTGPWIHFSGSSDGSCISLSTVGLP